MNTKNNLYIDLLMHEWRMERCSSTIQSCMRWALCAYPAETLLVLRREPRLQVEVLNPVPETVWAYFPIHQGQVKDQHLNLQLNLLVAGRGLRLRREARVLLLLGARLRRGETADDCGGQFLHHFGHILLYLRSPESPNECDDARHENAVLCDWTIPKAKFHPDRGGRKP